MELHLIDDEQLNRVNDLFKKEEERNKYPDSLSEKVLKIEAENFCMKQELQQAKAFLIVNFGDGQKRNHSLVTSGMTLDKMIYSVLEHYFKNPVLKPKKDFTKEDAVELRKAGFTIRQIQVLMGYKSPRSVQKLLK